MLASCSAASSGCRCSISWSLKATCTLPGATGTLRPSVITSSRFAGRGAGRDLLRHLERIDPAGAGAHTRRQRAVSGSDLQVGAALGQKALDRAQVLLDPGGADARIGPPAELGVVRNTAKELVVDLGIEARALLAGRAPQAIREAPLDLVVAAKLLRACGRVRGHASGPACPVAEPRAAPRPGRAARATCGPSGRWRRSGTCTARSRAGSRTSARPRRRRTRARGGSGRCRARGARRRGPSPTGRRRTCRATRTRTGRRRSRRRGAPPPPPARRSRSAVAASRRWNGELVDAEATRPARARACSSNSAASSGSSTCPGGTHSKLTPSRASRRVKRRSWRANALEGAAGRGPSGSGAGAGRRRALDDPRSRRAGRPAGGVRGRRCAASSADPAVALRSQAATVCAALARHEPAAVVAPPPRRCRRSHIRAPRRGSRRCRRSRSRLSATSASTPARPRPPGRDPGAAAGRRSSPTTPGPSPASGSTSCPR